MKRSSLFLAALMVGSFAVNAAAQDSDKRTIVTYTGAITKFERVEPAMVYLKTDKGEISAELAPMTFIDEQKLIFAPEENITIKGYETSVDGKKRFVVTEVTTKDRRIVKFRGDDFNPVWVKTTTATGSAEKIVMLSGTIKSFERSDPAIVVVTSDKGDVHAELAPMTFIDEQKLVFTPKENVKLKGVEVMRDGRRVFVVTEVVTNEANIVKLRTDANTPVWKKVTSTTERADGTEITGPVTIIQTVDTDDGRLVTIKTDKGERVIALAPGTYLEKNRYVLKQGDTIHVQGWEVERPSGRVFLASEVRVGSNNWKFRRPDRTVLWN